MDVRSLFAEAFVQKGQEIEGKREYQVLGVGKRVVGKFSAE